MGFRGQDAWRRHPWISGLWKSPFPGFKPAAIAFGFYLVIDAALKPAELPETKGAAAHGGDNSHH